MEEMDDKKREIILQASNVYMHYGIKSVTMDEMARQLGISKKTLYQYVEDKNDLVKQCLLIHTKEQENEVCKMKEESGNAIEQLLKMSRFITKTLKQIHPSIFFDLSRYHPDVMKMMDNHKKTFVCGSIVDNLKLGIEQGMYRQNLNPEIIARFYATMTDDVLNINITEQPTHRPEAIYSELFRYHIRGIATKKGIDYLKEIVKNDPELSTGIEE